ncbi:N-acetylmuramoyl-L-alanine amidase family protein [Tenacibaculum salmonis]|uniref:N-acetylmuramoyl-L-alanine amidase family protein n=1 Tax=Tenacibaculum sp. P3-BQ1 TaxID=3232310 RepID=UPI0034DF7C28
MLGLSTVVSAQKKYTIVLDAGHGGKDGGASRGAYIEKKIALKLALKVGDILKKDNTINVVYTRKKDVFVELHKRASIANKKNADLFVSIHCNSNSSGKPHGSETYVLGLKGNDANFEIVKKENAVILLEDDYKKNYDYDPNSAESLIGLSVLQEENLDASLSLASLVQTNFKSIKRYDRKVKQANFLVLRETVMPSVLIELGFLSNKTEGKFLNSSYGQLKMAKSLATAIKNYVKRLKLNTVQEKVIVKSSEKKETKKVKKTSSKSIKKKRTKKVSSKIIFKVQVSASRKKLRKSSFKGLKDIESMFIGGYYKYYYGSSPSFSKVKKSLIKARKIGYKDAWVVAFKGDKRISVKEALKKH